jgi:hypothetical protein
MTHPDARDVAESIRIRLRDGGVSRATAAAAAGITERALRRRLEYETPFRAHEVVAIERLLVASYPAVA